MIWLKIYNLNQFIEVSMLKLNIKLLLLPLLFNCAFLKAMELGPVIPTSDKHEIKHMGQSVVGTQDGSTPLDNSHNNLISPIFAPGYISQQNRIDLNENMSDELSNMTEQNFDDLDFNIKHASNPESDKEGSLYPNDIKHLSNSESDNEAILDQLSDDFSTNDFAQLGNTTFDKSVSEYLNILKLQIENLNKDLKQMVSNEKLNELAKKYPLLIEVPTEREYPDLMHDYIPRKQDLDLENYKNENLNK